MITIDDLNVSRETCLTELNDSEMMANIIGGRFFKPIFKVNLKQSRGVRFGVFGIDVDGDGTVEDGETLPIFSGIIELEFGFEDDD